MIGRVRRRSCAPPSFGDFVRWRFVISRRRSCASPSLGDFFRCRSDISCRRSRAPPFLRDFVRCRSGISRRRPCAPPSLRDFVAGAPTSPAACGGAVQTEKENQRSSELDADFLFSVCGEKEIRTPDTLLEYTRFPGVPLKPLEHLSRTAL